MKNSYDIAIIGGGASGLAAAVTAGRRPDLSVAVFEKKETAGKKLSATGNGRCNLSNIRCDNFEEVMDFFGSTGIAVRRDEEGRLYPYGEEAGEVTALLTSRVLSYGVDFLLNSEIIGMEAEPRGGFLLFVGAEKREVHARAVLIAAGGKSYASMGTTGDGYVMARKLGHSVTSLVPALTGVEVCEDISNLKGVRTKAEASLYRNGQMIFSERGEVQFRADSLSGICIMNMSRHIRRGAEYEIALNLTADLGTEELENILTVKLTAEGMEAADCLRTLVKGPMALRALSQAGIEPEEPGTSVVNDAVRFVRLKKAISDMRFTVSGLKGWNEAQVTSGGVPVDEVDGLTMESKLVPGLFFSGEVLDYDGPCGGYNLHHAWLTGIRAGKGMADRCTESIR
ncbi:MAG: aminoacetone oxidase family FAD-binding enzyme [Anaerovoracaceae bacterium]